MAQLISRAGWGAKPPRGSYTTVRFTRGVKVHYTGGFVSPKIVDDHRLCIEHVISIQRMHMAGGREQPYMDIGYSMVACPHRRIFMGRGPHNVPAANGAGLNSLHYAVLALVGNTGFTEPNDELLHAVLDAIDYLREKGDAGREIRGHRDGYSTSCPGGPLYAWIRRGAPRPKESTPAPKPEPEEDPIKIVLRDGVPDWVGRTLRVTSPMMRGADVRLWQERLARRGWTIDADGIYGPQSLAVCRGFQRATGLKPTGQVDEPTWAMTWSWRPPATGEPEQPGQVDETN
ncbi:peptidoglycan recognition protein family protein [Microtetraspora malaysiensis]|uniref:peptidoglycan recognition protein family protein n=1 Tax=Microtetraspora malaysiensis TaxID=161358 RepID=UPI003D8B1FCD